MKAARATCAELAEAAATVRAPFAWEDGPLVTAMRRGDMILIDELNLADDAVIERLNRHGTEQGIRVQVGEQALHMQPSCCVASLRRQGHLSTRRPLLACCCCIGYYSYYTLCCAVSWSRGGH